MVDNDKTNAVLLLAGATFIIGLMAGLGWAMNSCVRKEQRLVAEALREALAGSEDL